MLRVRVTVLLLLTSACLVDVNGGIEDGQAGGTTKGGAGEGGTGATGLGGATGGQGGAAGGQGGAGGEGGAPNGGGGMGGVGGMPVSCTALEFDGDDRALVAGLGDQAPAVTLHGSFVPSNLAAGATDRNVLLLRPGQFQLSVRSSAANTAEFALQSLAQTSCITLVTTAPLTPSAATFQFEAEIKSTELSVAIDGGVPIVFPLPCTLPASATANSNLFLGDWDSSAGATVGFSSKPFTGSISLLKAGGSACINFNASLASPGVDPIPSVSGCNLGLDLEDDPNDPVLLCQ